MPRRTEEGERHQHTETRAHEQGPQIPGPAIGSEEEGDRGESDECGRQRAREAGHHQQHRGEKAATVSVRQDREERDRGADRERHPPRHHVQDRRDHDRPGRRRRTSRERRRRRAGAKSGDRVGEERDDEGGDDQQGQRPDERRQRRHDQRVAAGLTPPYQPNQYPSPTPERAASSRAMAACRSPSVGRTTTSATVATTATRNGSARVHAGGSVGNCRGTVPP